MVPSVRWITIVAERGRELVGSLPVACVAGQLLVMLVRVPPSPGC